MTTALPRPALSMPEPARALVLAGAAGLAALGLSVALLWPGQIGLFLLLVAGGSALIAACAFPIPACMAWLLAVGLTPDMWLGEMLGDGAAAAVVAALKLAGLALVALCMARFGARWDAFNPGLAFAAMFAAGLAHGLHPNLAPAESLRSFLGSAAPFAFGFVRLPPRWTRGVVLAVLAVPLASVTLGAGLAAAGLRPLFVEGAGLRLQGAGHPAFLGGFALAASCAALVELLRTGRARHAAWLALNMAILLLSGARAPLAIGVAIVGLSLLVVRAPRLRRGLRLGLLAGGALAGLALLAAAGMLGEIRVFHLLATDAENLSGREEIWPLFQAAWDASPIWGWGVGAGKVLVGVDTPLARLLGTTAAHNEYLRIGAEGGYAGLGLLILCSVGWAMAHLRALRGPDRWAMALVLIGFAVHSATDNTLIATTSSVLFAWIAAVFARTAIHEGNTR